MHVFFAEDGTMEKKVFLATWKDIPAQNEVQYTIQNCECNAGMLVISQSGGTRNGDIGFCRQVASINSIIYIVDGVSTKMQQNNAFTVAKRTLEGQDMVYQSIKFTNNVWALAEQKIQPGNPSITVSIYQ